VAVEISHAGTIDPDHPAVGSGMIKFPYAFPMLINTAEGKVMF